MKNKITHLITLFALSSSLLYSQEPEMIEAKTALISSHIAYAKSNIDRKCKKIKTKIKRLEDNLSSSNGASESHRLELINKITKYEERLDTLRLLRGSMDVINFKAL